MRWRARAAVAAMAMAMAWTGLAAMPGATEPAGVARTGASRQDLLPAVVTGLLGEWRGTGVVTGRASDLTMTWSREVGGAFVHLRFRNAMAAGGGRPAEVFEGRGYYRVTTSAATTSTGTWIDSRGLILPVAVTIAADSFTSDWGAAGTEQGRTVYRLIGAGELEVTDFVRAADGPYRVFGRSHLRRDAADGRAATFRGRRRDAPSSHAAQQPSGR
jgi:hypothetical protein